MAPTCAARLVVVAAALLAFAGGWPVTEAAAQPAPPTRSAPADETDAGTGSRSAERAAGAARARAAEAERQARAAAAAARRAAQLAAAGQRVRATWEGRGRPARLVIVRDDTLDVVTQGRLTRRTARRVGPLTVTTLSRYLPRSWLAVDGTTATLNAAVVLTPNVVLDVGGDVTTVRLGGGATLPEAASIYTGSGTLRLHGVTVTSTDASGQPLPASPGRPFLVATSGGRIEAADVTVTDLGTADQGPQPRPAVLFNAGSTGSVVRSTFTRNSVGLQLAGSQDVRLEDVTVTESLGHGVATSRDTGTVLRGIRAERNAGDGIRLNSTAPAQPITGITTAGNGRFGIAAVKLRDARLEDLRTTSDTAGGLELSQAARVTVSGLTAITEPVGAYIHISSTEITLERLAVTGGRRGVAVEKTTRGLVLRDSTFDRVKLTGVAVGGSVVELRDVAVTDSQTGVRVERGADGVTLAGVRLQGGLDGVVATAGTRGLVLDGLSAVGVENDAVRSFSPDARIGGGEIVGANCGITAAAATTISNVTMSLVNDGIRARSAGLVRAEGVDIDAVAVGIDAGTQSSVVVADSRVRAFEAVRGDFTEQGTNELSLPPLNLLGAIGIPLILLALVLELVHIARQRRAVGRRRRWRPPQVSAEAIRRSVTKTAEADDRSTGARTPVPH
jgi:Right handed beta helix region